jgi:hypothetical protein
LNRTLSEPELSETIRSVSHLVLARFWPMSWLPKFRTERSRLDCSRPGSLRLGFLGQAFYYHTRPFWQARVFTNSAPILPPAGPENYQCRAAFIQCLRDRLPVSRLQPFVDSRHGRIACKNFPAVSPFAK